MKINCDLGEGFEEIDALLIPLVDQVNIACGGHAGSKASMRRCVQLARDHQTLIGAHPSYPDKVNFGRVSLDIALLDLAIVLKKQIEQLIGCCDTLKCKVTYIKPHGALYHDGSTQLPVFELLVEVIESIVNDQNYSSLALMMPANITAEMSGLAQKRGVPLIREGFADRAYTCEGNLVSRKFEYAVHSVESLVLEQVRQFVELSGVKSYDQVWVPMSVDSLCVHGDTEGAVGLVKAIRNYL